MCNVCGATFSQIASKWIFAGSNFYGCLCQLFSQVKLSWIEANPRKFCIAKITCYTVSARLIRYGKEARPDARLSDSGNLVLGRKGRAVHSAGISYLLLAIVLLSAVNSLKGRCGLHYMLNATIMHEDSIP